MPVILALTYINRSNEHGLIINSKPITTDGLRLVTLKDEQDELINIFNEGLNELIKTQKYQKLIDKWQVGV